MNWYLEVLRKYAVFSGRARRMEYWMFLLIIAIAKSFVRLFNDFSRVRVGNMIYPGHGSVPEHTQPGKCLFG